MGPFIIDKIAPTLQVLLPETTSDSIIDITFGSTGNPYQVCISNSGYGNCVWEFYQTNRPDWPLEGNAGQKIFLFGCEIRRVIFLMHLLLQLNISQKMSNRQLLLVCQH
ncbi:MAG: hypothetical protein OMM_06174 [Candidatus Magnetoglobus multicellularis str. Araruama]|uniref:Uncharacterized protein n=1 Tax=Candidatus Magnetoglobus multicellularis str. Araruama TaxID=890399 RepID=A0A1V1NQV1_9BACT|nr:MAG: hypothetical protein OMM_06174 [Candidatus Magnetoglobus multicellularis str. Araruama]